MDLVAFTDPRTLASTPSSAGAIPLAVDLASQQRSEVRFLHVVPTSPSVPETEHPPDRTL